MRGEAGSDPGLFCFASVPWVVGQAVQTADNFPIGDFTGAKGSRLQCRTDDHHTTARHAGNLAGANQCSVEIGWKIA